MIVLIKILPVEIGVDIIKTIKIKLNNIIKITKIKSYNKILNINKIIKMKLNYKRNNIIKIIKIKLNKKGNVNLNYNELIKYFFSIY
jgi:hypothetical protein